MKAWLIDWVLYPIVLVMKWLGIPGPDEPEFIREARRADNALRIINSVETINQFLAISNPWVRSLKGRVREEDWMEICSAMLHASVRACADHWDIPGMVPSDD